MEGMVAKALKSSLRRELAVVKSTQPAFYEELMYFNSNNGVSGEDFSVDDLLDFSNGEFPVENGRSNGQDDDEEEKDSSSSSFSSQDHVEDDNNSNSSGFFGTNDSGSIFASELAVPTDDIAELEWVSHFVDDSIPELSLLYPTTIAEQRKTATSASFIGKRRPEVPVPRPSFTRGPCFPSPVPVKPRSKRQRANGSRVWLSGSPSLTDSFSAPSSCSSGISSTPCLIVDRVSEPPVKKQKKKSEGQTDGSNTVGGSQFQRRCSHCQVQKTPQWRAGPLGAKTLCNACGVRYKSGRLFPEYRPACSPTFSSEIHSNSHRKVLEMRKRKDTTGPEPVLTQTQVQRMVPIC